MKKENTNYQVRFTIRTKLIVITSLLLIIPLLTADP